MTDLEKALNLVAALSVEIREQVADVAEEMMELNYDRSLPLLELRYWHDDEIPAGWDTELCERLSILEWDEAIRLVEKIRE